MVVFSLIRQEDLDREEAKTAAKATNSKDSGPEDDSEAGREFQPGADDVD